MSIDSTKLKLRNRILEMLPVNQEDVWKQLGLGHREVSQVVRQMADEKLINRTKVKGRATNFTYLLEKNGSGSKKKTDKVRKLHGHFVDRRHEMVGERIPAEELKAMILDMLPVRQDEVWKKLKQSHSYVSIIVRQMIDEGAIVRTLLAVDGFRKSYMLEPVAKKAKAKKQKNRFDVLLTSAGLAPCIGCQEDCDAAHCHKILVWATAENRV